MSKELMELKKSGTVISYEYTTTNPEAIIEDHIKNYGVIPRKGDVMVMQQGKKLTPYITKSGWGAIANEKGISTTFDQPMIGKGKVQVKCKAILPNGVYHEAWGYCDTSEPGKDRMNKCISMAMTRARNKALEYATQCKNCSWEEIDSPEMRKRAKDVEEFKMETLQKCPWCGLPNAYSKKQKKCFECGKTLEEKL